MCYIWMMNSAEAGACVSSYIPLAYMGVMAYLCPNPDDGWVNLNQQKLPTVNRILSASKSAFLLCISK